MKPIIITLVGLPGSGKSTATKGYKSGITISSDAIRKELYGSEEIQGNPAEVFDVFYKRAKEISKTEDVIVLDATNLTIKNRKRIFETFPTENYTHYAFVMNVPYETCLERNSKRERVVPEAVMERMQKQYQRPTLSEGYDVVVNMVKENFENEN